jgi:transcriptional regulator
MGESRDKTTSVLQGTLEMLILKALSRRSMHGYGVTEFIFSRSGEEFQVEEGALYPALHRLELRGLVESAWGLSENNRRAKYYTLTRSGRKQLAEHSSGWTRVSTAIARVMET